jgi:hypothetical protein
MYLPSTWSPTAVPAAPAIPGCRVSRQKRTKIQIMERILRINIWIFLLDNNLYMTEREQTCRAFKTHYSSMNTVNQVMNVLSTLALKSRSWKCYLPAPYYPH